MQKFVPSKIEDLTKLTFKKVYLTWAAGVSYRNILTRSFYPYSHTKFRFYPNAEQEKVVLQTMGNSRFVYNYFLQKQQQLYTQYKEQLQLFKNNQITEEPQSTFLTAIDMANQLPQLKKDVFSIPRDNFKFINFASNLSNETDYLLTLINSIV